MHATDDSVSARLQSVLRFQREDVRGFGKSKCSVSVRNQARGRQKAVLQSRLCSGFMTLGN